MLLIDSYDRCVYAVGLYVRPRKLNARVATRHILRTRVVSAAVLRPKHVTRPNRYPVTPPCPPLFVWSFKNLCVLDNLHPSHRVMGDKVADLHIAIDPGTTTWTVCWRWSSSRTVHTLKFSSTYSEKNNEELDATIGRSQSHWYYGLDVRHLDVQKFVNIKLGIIGEEPYTRQLKESFQAARRVYGVEETPVTLFANLFKHILMTLAEQCLEAPESEALMSGRRFHDIRKLCWITHPVRHNESLRIILFEAALAAKFHRVDGVSESMAAAHFMAFQTKHQLFPPDKTALIVDCGGGSTVMLSGGQGGGAHTDAVGRISWVCIGNRRDGFDRFPRLMVRMMLVYIRGGRVC